MYRIPKDTARILIGILMFSLLFVAPAFAASDKLTFLVIGIDAEGLEVTLERFTELTGIEVEVLRSTTWDAQRERVQVMTLGGVAPDVVYVDSATYNYLLLQNLAMPLDDYIARDNIDVSRYPQAVLDFWYYQGSLYGLPTALSLHTTYYNVDQYRAAGVPEPPIDWDGDEWLWDEFVQTMRRLTVDTDGDGVPERYGLQTFGWGGGANHIGLWGQYWVNEDVTEWYGDRPEVIAALEKTVGLRTVDKVIGGNLVNGTAATNVAQSNYLNFLFDSDTTVNWNVAAMPKGTHRASQTGFHGISVARFAPNPEGAWQLVKFLAYDTEGAVLFSRAENRVPVLRETGQDFIERYADSVIPVENLGSMIQATNYVYNLRYTRHPRGNEIYQLLNSMHTPLVSGQKSVRVMLEEISQQARAIIADW